MIAPKFDSILLDTLRILGQQFGDSPPETTLIRDALGKLVVTIPDNAMSDSAEWDALADELHRALGIYSPGSKRILLRHSDLVVPEDILDSPDRVRFPDASKTWLIDRLQTNQDWLRKPLVEQPPLPAAVAFSIKGGVGRTTAFALWAWYLAKQSKNVVLVDLEAPGVAGVLLDEDHMPDYGLVDWLVECLVGQPNEALLRECMVDCALSNDEPGRIRVLPAFGRKTQDYVNKLGRIYMPTFRAETGEFSGLAERLLILLQQLAGLFDKPDAVLLDARAGLHDIGSAAVTRLGAKVFLFARDEYQSWQAYKKLFQHLRMAQSVEWGMPENDLRWRLSMVAAQTESTDAARLRFVERSYETWQEFYDTDEIEEEEKKKLGREPQLFNPEDTGPHQPAFIGFDPRVRSFDLIDSQARPSWQAVEQAFGKFFPNATTRLLQNNLAQETI